MTKRLDLILNGRLVQAKASLLSMLPNIARRKISLTPAVTVTMKTPDLTKNQVPTRAEVVSGEENEGKCAKVLCQLRLVDMCV
jgi:hypothetical protein